MLKGVDGVEVVGEGASVADALKIAQELAPDVMLLNLRQRGGAEAAARIADVCPNVRTVILTASENEQKMTPISASLPRTPDRGVAGRPAAFSSTRGRSSTTAERCVPTLQV